MTSLMFRSFRCKAGSSKIVSMLHLGEVSLSRARIVFRAK